MRNASVLHLEEQGAKILHHAREAAGLLCRWEPEFAPGRDDDVVAAMHQGRSARRSGQKHVAGDKLVVDLERGGLGAPVDNPCITAELGHDPIVLRSPGSASRRCCQGEERNEHDG